MNIFGQYCVLPGQGSQVVPYRYNPEQPFVRLESIQHTNSYSFCCFFYYEEQRTRLLCRSVNLSLTPTSSDRCRYIFRTWRERRIGIQMEHFPLWYCELDYTSSSAGSMSGSDVTSDLELWRHFPSSFLLSVYTPTILKHPPFWIAVWKSVTQRTHSDCCLARTTLQISLLHVCAVEKYHSILSQVM